MANDPPGHEAHGLGARLRTLRAQYPTLAVLTALIEHDERRVIVRATMLIDGEPRARGHAAQRADPAGVGVAVAERLAVAQALLLGGFDDPADAVPTDTTAASASTSPPVPPHRAVPPEAVPARDATGGGAVSRRRGRAVRPAAALDDVAVSAATTREVPVPSSASADPPPTHDADASRAAVAASAVASPPGDPATSAVTVGDQTPQAPALADTSMSAQPGTAANAVPTPGGEDLLRSIPPRRQRDRKAERERARARRATAPDASAVDRTAQVAPTTSPEPVVAAPPASEQPAAPAAATQGVASRAPSAAPVDAPALPRATAGPPVSAPTAAPRRTRPRSTAAARPGTPIPAAPPAPVTQEGLRAAWQPGRPIPAWWPPERGADARPLTGAGADRLRAAALAEEITAAQLDAYCTLLFGVAVAGLTRAQGALLAERLNPAYPSPLEELRARRILHSLAVGNPVPVADGQAGFVRWTDVPPVADAPAAPAAPPPTWRDRAVPGWGRRR